MFLGIRRRPCWRRLLIMILRCSSEDIVKWDMAETAKGGPFKEILEGTLLASDPSLTSR